MQTKLLNIRISEKLLNDYKEFCDDNQFTVSKRLRRLMESDIDKWKKFKAGQLLR